MMSKWVPVHERGRAVGLLWSSSFAGAAVGNLWQLIEKQVEQQVGYAVVFICMGIAGLIWFALWCYFVCERPEEDRSMRQRERRLILDSVLRPRPGHELRRSAQLEPKAWLRVIFNAPVLAIIVAHVSFSLSLYVFTVTVPKFLKKVCLRAVP